MQWHFFKLNKLEKNWFYFLQNTIMETERSLLGSRNIPRYTFLGNGSSPKPKIRRFPCCVCLILTGFLMATVVIALAYYLSSNYSEESFPNPKALDTLLQLKWPLREEKYIDSFENLNDETRAVKVGMEGLKEKDSIEEIIPPIPMNSPSFKHHLATPTSKQAQEISRLGYILNLASKEIKKCYENNTENWKEDKLRRWVFAKALMSHLTEEPAKNITMKCTPLPYRSSNGTCNNLVNPTWGAALQSFRRLLLPNYKDGVADPREASDGSSLPSAREVSLVVHRPSYRNDVNFTIMLAVWGQFIDHDITATAISRGKNGSPIQCCQTKLIHPECFPVSLTSSDPFRLQYNITCMDFVRSAPAPTNAFGPREQLNQATSFLDGSVVYGNDDEVTNQLRTFTGGELKMLKSSAGDLLPVSEDPNDGCNRKEEFERGRYCFLSGDKRANENLPLTAMHLLFARQHNLVATKLAKLNSHWTDEKLFQETRKIIGAQIQHITYNEFLPSILPEKLMNHLNISTKSLGYSDSYNNSVNPTVANVFASAAFRFGHTLLPVQKKKEKQRSGENRNAKDVSPKFLMTMKEIQRGLRKKEFENEAFKSLMQFLRKNSTQEEFLELHKMLFNPFELFEAEFLENFMEGAMNTSSAKFDIYFSQELTQKLFQNEQKRFCGLDLVSLNIQRGRDHGLPSYPNWRSICGLKKPESFDDLKDDIDEATLRKLEKLYKAVDDLDLYTGGLAEKPLTGSLVGPTITCLIADQFLRLKIGDRYWYERMEEPQKYTLEQLKEIRGTSLAKIICETSAVKKAQPHVMRRVGVDNEFIPCEKFTFSDFSAWKET